MVIFPSCAKHHLVEHHVRPRRQFEKRRMTMHKKPDLERIALGLDPEIQ